MRFLTDHPDDENAQGLWLQIASLYQEELGDYRQAVEAYEHALESGEAPVAEARYRQGECHEKDNSIDLALASYEAAANEGATVDPFRIASLARMAEIAEERGDWGAALSAWQQIQDAGGKAEWTAMAVERIDAIRSSGVVGG